MDRRGGVDELFDGLDIICAEDLWIIEIGYEKGIRGWSRLRKRWNCGKVD